MIKKIILCLPAFICILFSEKTHAQKSSSVDKLSLFAGIGGMVTTPLSGSDYDPSLFSTFIPSAGFTGEIIYGHRLGLESSLHTGLGFSVLKNDFKLSITTPDAAEYKFIASTAAFAIKIPLYAKWTIAKNKQGKRTALTAGAELNAVNIFSQGFTASGTGTWEHTDFEVADAGDLGFMAAARIGVEADLIGESTKVGWYAMALYQLVPTYTMTVNATTNTGEDAYGTAKPGVLALFVGLHVPLLQ